MIPRPKRIDSIWSDSRFLGWRLGPFGFMQSWVNSQDTYEGPPRWEYDYWKVWMSVGPVELDFTRRIKAS